MIQYDGGVALRTSHGSPTVVSPPGAARAGEMPPSGAVPAGGVWIQTARVGSEIRHVTVQVKEK